MTNPNPQHPVDDLVERLATSSVALRQNWLFTGDGQAVKLGVQADEMEDAAIYIRDLEAKVSQLEADLKAAETRSQSQPCGEASADAKVFAGLDAEEPAACRLRWAVERAMLRAGFVHPTGIDNQERQKFQSDLVAAFKSAAPATTSVSEGSLVLGGEGSSNASRARTGPQPRPETDAEPSAAVKP